MPNTLCNSRRHKPLCKQSTPWNFQLRLPLRNYPSEELENLVTATEFPISCWPPML